jgi:hypothetical protein
MKLKRFAYAAEIFASFAIAVSLVFLILEIRNNTLVQERQMQMDRNAGFTDPYISAPDVLKVYAKVKAVDGGEPVVEAFMDRYNLTPEEAVLWSRLVQSTWFVWQSHYLFGGPSNDLESTIRGVFKYPDVQIAYELNEDSLLSPEFIAYVESIIGEQ